MSENHIEHLEEGVRDIKAALARLEAQLKKKPGRPVIWTALGLLVGIQAIPAVTFALIAAFSHPAHGAETQYQEPYSCSLLYDEQRKCAFGSCDRRTVERLRNECLRDGGRP